MRRKTVFKTGACIPKNFIVCFSAIQKVRVSHGCDPGPLFLQECFWRRSSAKEPFPEWIPCWSISFRIDRSECWFCEIPFHSA